ncbi:MAG: hypothetical protein C0428_05630 [Polaromonas sp.]|nr:hypothetical protein [Polaromonas sp.]
MSGKEFFLPLAFALVLLFALRYYRAGSGAYAFVSIDNEFRAYRRGKFAGAEVTVLYTDKRIDRFAPSRFKEIRGPAVAIYLCRDEKSGQHWLWRLYRPTETDPSLQKLTPQEAEAMLQRKEKLLKELCPRQHRRPTTRPPAEKPGKRNLWDG